MPVPRITRDDLKQRLDGTGETAPAIVDARLKYPYEHSTATLPGAIRLAPESPDLSSLPRDRDIVVYDSDPDEIVAERVADALIRRGHRALVLQGGIGDWITAKLPTAAKAAVGAPAPAAPAAAGPPKG